MNRILRKAFMTRSRLKRRYNLERSTINFENYKKQSNICVYVLHKSKTQYFHSINVKNVTDNKGFWKTVWPIFRKNVKLQALLFYLEETKSYKTVKL